ncbi:MAG: SAM-dependent methyltransferase [Candidatus Micrarchaeia archaeon]
MQKCIIINDSKFIHFAYSELRKILPDNTKLSMLEEYGIILVSAELDKPLCEYLMENSIFINFAMNVRMEFDVGKPADMISHIQSLLEKGKSFKIEVKRIKSKIELSAKTLEVLMGESLEKLGYIADLKNPDVIIGIIIAGSKVYAGSIPKGSELDPFRFSNPSGQINRAEFKIAEASKFFDLSTNGGSVLDIGAAPGGWTKFMLSENYRVVAIDGAAMDYEVLKKYASIIVVANKIGQSDQMSYFQIGEKLDKESLKKLAETVRSYRLVHIMLPFNKVSEGIISALGPFSLLLIDSNTAPSESASFVKSLFPYLKCNAKIVMTVKLIDYDVKKHIDDVENTLKGSCSVIKFKKLPHNRRELTMFAILK